MFTTFPPFFLVHETYDPLDTKYLSNCWQSKKNINVFQNISYLQIVDQRSVNLLYTVNQSVKLFALRKNDFVTRLFPQLA